MGDARDRWCGGRCGVSLEEGGGGLLGGQTPTSRQVEVGFVPFPGASKNCLLIDRGAMRKVGLVRVVLFGLSGAQHSPVFRIISVRRRDPACEIDDCLRLRGVPRQD